MTPIENTTLLVSLMALACTLMIIISFSLINLYYHLKERRKEE